MSISIIWIGLLFSVACIDPLTGITALLSILILGDRQAAHLHAQIGPVPLYITEAVLGALLIHVIKRLRSAKPMALSMETPLKGFYAVSILSAARGFLLYPVIQVIRDAALVYYSLFALWMQDLLRDDAKKLKIVGIWMAHVVLLKAVLTYTNWRFFYQEGSAVSMYFVCTLILSFMTFPQWARCYWWYPAVIFLTYQVMVIVFRSAWVGLFVGCLFFGVAALKYRFSLTHRLVVGFLLTAGVALGFLCPPKKRFLKPIGKTDLAQMTKILGSSIDRRTHPEFYPDATASSNQLSPPKINSPAPAVISPVKTAAPSPESAPHHTYLNTVKSNQVVSQFLSMKEGIAANNSSTRFWLAEDLLEELLDVHFDSYQSIRMAPESLSGEERQRISQQLHARFQLESERPNSWSKRLGWGTPWIRRCFGIPFGKVFLPPRTFYWMDKVGRYDPHDSFLSILYRTGFVGLLFFIGMLYAEFKRSFVGLTRLPADRQLWILGLWGALFSFCAEASFSVSLENAFKGIFFWIFLGCLRALNREGSRR